jgi:hypothetical protein
MMVCSKLGPGQASAWMHEQQLTATLRPHAHSMFVFLPKARSVPIIQIFFHAPDA